MKAWELEKCIDEFGTEIYRFCMKLCMDKENAEDLYQQTFLKALESDMELDWEQNPKALFFSFAYNLWKSEQRKNARRSTLVPCANFDEANENELRSEENIEENIFRQELIVEINKIIENLPEKFRVPLILYYLFEQPIGEIGICLYMGTVGILITLLGVKRANLKENITVHIQKRGALV